MTGDSYSAMRVRIDALQAKIVAGKIALAQSQKKQTFTQIDVVFLENYDRQLEILAHDLREFTRRASINPSIALREALRKDIQFIFESAKNLIEVKNTLNDVTDALAKDGITSLKRRPTKSNEEISDEAKATQRRLAPKLAEMTRSVAENASTAVWAKKDERSQTVNLWREVNRFYTEFNPEKALEDAYTAGTNARPGSILDRTAAVQCDEDFAMLKLQDSEKATKAAESFLRSEIRTVRNEVGKWFLAKRRQSSDPLTSAMDARRTDRPLSIKSFFHSL